MLSSLAVRLVGALCLAGALAGAIGYVRHIRAKNERLEASNASLVASAKITFRQQEVSDRAQIELSELRAKARKENATLVSDLSLFMRDTCPGVSAPSGDAARIEPESPKPESSKRDQVANLCAQSAIESDDRGDQITKIHEWYESIRAIRQ